METETKSAETKDEGAKVEETPQAEEKVEQPTLERVDLMTFLFLNEKGQRIEAEKRAHQGEFDRFIADINQKYGIMLTEVSVDMATGVITPRGGNGAS